MGSSIVIVVSITCYTSNKNSITSTCSFAAKWIKALLAPRTWNS